MSGLIGGTARLLILVLLFFMPAARGGVPGWGVSVMHLATLLALALHLIDCTVRCHWRWIATPLDRLLAATVLLCGFAALCSQNRWNSGWAFLLCVNYIVLYYLAVRLFRTRFQVRLLYGALIASALWVTLIGWLTWWDIHPYGWWRFEDISHSGTLKMAGSFGNPNHFACYMALSIPVALAGGFLVFRSLWGRICCFGAAALVAWCLALSFSRGAWGAGLCGIVFMAIWLSGSRSVDRKKLVVAGIGAAATALLFILSSSRVVLRLVTLLEHPAEVFGGRLAVWKATAVMIGDHPWLGIGPGNFGVVFTRYQPPGSFVRNFSAENDYLHWASEIGLGAFVLAGWMIAAILVGALQKRNHSSRMVSGVTAGAVSGLATVALHALVDFPFHIPSLALIALMLSVLATVLPSSAARRCQ